MFVRVVQSGSFSATARETGVGQPFVSKQIAQLEAHLGAQLSRRTSRSMTLTEVGQSFYEAAVHVSLHQLSTLYQQRIFHRDDRGHASLPFDGY